MNDAPTDIAITSSSVAENQPSGTVVGTFSSTDVDGGPTYTYSLVAGAGDTGNASFSIVADTLQTGAVFDFETQSSYSIRVRTDDGHGGTFDEVFTIAVTNVNEAPTAVSQTLSVNEDGTLVITVEGHDVDEPAVADVVFEIISPVTHGTLTPSGSVVQDAIDHTKYTQQFTYVPSSNYNGADSFAFTFRTPSIAWPGFGSGATVDSATGGGSVVMGDVNNDGNLDVIAGGYFFTFNRPATVYLGNGDGTFQAGITISGSEGDKGMALGDVNADGNLDYVIGSWGSNSILSRVFLGNGDGTFQAGLGIGTAPADYDNTYCIALGDVNGDSNLDLVKGNDGSQGLVLHVGNGDGTFGDGITIGSATYIYSIALADVNNDGKLDIIAGKSGQSAVYLGNGDGTFGAGISIGSGAYYTQSLALGDVNGDSRLDLAQGNNGGPNRVWLGNDDGTFALWGTVGSSNSIPSIALGNVNGDFNLDIVYGDGAPKAYLNQGAGWEASPPATVSITVDPVNDAPSMDTSGTPFLTPITEDVPSAANPGTSISAIIAALGGTGISDVDTGAVEGIAIRGVSTSYGTWQFTLDGGTTWAALTGVSDTSARLLRADDPNTYIRFQPDPDYYGTINGQLQFRAWDTTSGTHGGLGDASVNGGTTAFSTQFEQASIVVTGVNDAPVNNVPFATMLNDINPGSGSSLGANSFWVVGSNLFFRADDGVHGTELWVTDGTPTGTHLVKDIVVGSGSPTFLGDTGFVAAGGRLFFSVNDGVNGMEPWVSDGTEAGTYIVQDINPGAASSNPGSFALLGSRIYYGATDATHGSELWSTDFTTLATEMVKDIYASGGSGPIYLANCNGTLFFQAMDSQGWELWKSDGTEGGTVMVKDIVPGASSSQPSNLKAVGSTLYFTATTPGEGWELWQSDGTDSGTVMVRDIRVGVTGSNPGWLCDVGGTLFFQANDGTGSDLWRTDATFGAVKVNTSISNITPLYITAFGGQAYFQATDPTHGTEPWVSDGTDAGTHILFDLVPGTSSSTPNYFAAAGGYLYFRGQHPSYGIGLYRTDGTAAGTDFHYVGGSADYTTAIGADVYFRAPDGFHGAELWKAGAQGIQFASEDTPLTFADGAGRNRISITDVDAGSDLVQITLTVNNGTVTLASGFESLGLSFSWGDGTVDTWMRFEDTVADINTALNGIVFTPPPHFNGYASLIVDTDDLGHNPGPLNYTDSNQINITVLAVNDAPVLDNTSVRELTAIDEDDPPSGGNNIWSLIFGSFSDADGDSWGVAITAANNANGTWEYSINSGANWLPLGSPSESSARLLHDDALVRFLPAANYYGAVDPGITYRAWDRTQGTNGGTWDIATNGFGGSTAFSTDVETASITVNAVNDTPTVTTPISDVTVSEDAADTVFSLYPNFQDVEDADNLLTYSVVNNTNPGLFADVNITDPTNFRLDYAPDANGTADITIRATDTGGLFVDDTFTVTVNAVNDAPVMDTGGDPFLVPTNEDVISAFNPGTQIASIIAAVGGTGITDADTGSAEGIAVTYVDNTNGTWEFTLDGGTIWTPLAGVSDTSARLFRADDPNTYIRFQPNANWNGTVANGLGFRAWDVSSGTHGALTDVSVHGGATPFSDQVETASIQVIAANDAPVIAAPASDSTTEDVVRVFSTGNGNLISISDEDAGAAIVQVELLCWFNGTLTLSNPALVDFGFVADGFGSPAGDGTDDATMRFRGTLSEINTALEGLQFTPEADFTGTAWIQVNVNDLENSPAPAQTATHTFTVTVNAVNEAPVLAGTNNLMAISEDHPGGDMGTTVASLIAGTVTDPDGPGDGIAVAGVDEANGQWKYSIDGGTIWIDFDPLIADTHATLLGSTDRIRFEANADWNGLAHLYYRAWDQSPGYGNLHDTNADATLNGGSHGFSLASADATITVNAVNDAPSAVNMGPYSMSEDGTQTITLRGYTGTSALIPVNEQPQTLTFYLADISMLHGTLYKDVGLTQQFMLGDPLTAVGAGDQDVIVYYRPDADYYSPVMTPASFQWYVVDDGGTANGGLDTSIAVTTEITVNPVNDAPAFSAGGVIPAISEDVPPASNTGTLVLDMIADTIIDPDGFGALYGIAVTAADPWDGVWQYSLNNGTTWTDFGAVSDASATLLAADSSTRVRFVPDPEYSAVRSIGYRAWDQTSGMNGDTGVNVTVNGGTTAFSSGVQWADQTINAVNDAPVVTVGVGLATDEDTPLYFAGAGMLDVVDVDAATELVQVTLQVTDATLTLDGTTGLSFSFSDGYGTGSGDGTADSYMCFRGQLGDIHTALHGGATGMRLDPTPGFNGSVTFDITVNDLEHTPAPAQTDFESRIITVNAVNDAPTATNMTQTHTVAEDSGPFNLTDIVVTDPDPGDTITATLTLGDISSGILSGNDGATYTPATGVWTISGTISQVNTALANVTFTPAAEWNGSVGISTHVEDAAMTGPADGAISMTVTGVNDAPTATNMDQTHTVAEDSGALNLTDIVVTDSDMGDMITATLTLIDPAAGTLNSSAGTYDPFTGVWTYTGTVTQVNTALANAMYTTAANWSGTTSITTHIEDAAHTGPAPGMITVNVTPVNDVPSATNLNQGFPAEFEDNPVSLTPIVVTDVDAATDLITAVMTLTTPGTGSLSSSGGWYAPGTGVWTMTGTVATVNSALASLTFLPASNWYGMVNITTHVEDAAHTGPANGNVSINITSVNDAPTAVSVGTIQTDIDPVDRVEIVLSADPGAPNESGQTLTFHIDDASNLHGTLYDSQFGPGLLGSGSDVALAAPGPGTLTVWYTPDAAYHGAASFSYYVWDDGPTGGPYDQNTSTSAMVSLQVGPLEGTSPPPYTPPPPTDSGTQQNPSTGTEPGSTVGETPSVTGGTGGTTGGSDGTQSVAGEPTLMVQQAAVIGATETQTSTDQALQTAQAQSETAAQEAAQRTAQEAAQQATQTPPPTGEAPPAGAVQTPGEVAAAGQQSTPGTPTGPGEGPSPGPAIGPATAGPPSIVTGALFVPPPLINPSQMSAPIFQATAGTLVAIDLGGTTPPPTFTLDEGSAPGRPRVETPAYAPSSSGTTITVDQTQTAVDNCTQSPASAPGAEGLFGQ